MMIDIEEVLRMDRLEHIARAVHGRVEHDEEVGLYGSLQLRPADVYKRQLYAYYTRKGQVMYI